MGDKSFFYYSGVSLVYIFYYLRVFTLIVWLEIYLVVSDSWGLGTSPPGRQIDFNFFDDGENLIYQWLCHLLF